MIRKLRIKFIIIIMTIVTVMISSICWIMYSSMQMEIEEQTVSLLRTLASEPMHVRMPGAPDGEFMLPYFVLQTNRTGELIATGGSFYDLSDEAYLTELIEAVQLAGGEYGVLKEYNLRYYQHLGTRGCTIALCDMTNESSILGGLLHSCILAGSAGFLAFLLISILLSKWAVRPVEKAWKEQKQFIADASHELKTPLTVIMTNAELLQSPDFDEESRQQFTESISIMAQQMRGLVEKMLELARGDYQSQPVGQSEVDLSRLAEDAVLSFEAVFFEKGLSLDSDIVPEVVVRGDRSALRQVMEILLDNAQKYSTPGGTTVFSLTAAHGKCRFCAANPGPEIEPKDLKKIFQRFYRVDSARSRDGSFGLGLPIAQQIVQRHHGRIWAESADGINRFVVELPAVKQTAAPVPRIGDCQEADTEV